MENRLHPAVIVVLVALIILASAAAAQMPATTELVLASNVPTRLVFLDRVGGASTILSSVAIGSGQIYAMEESPDNRSLVAYGTTSEARLYDKKTGAVTQVGLQVLSAFPKDGFHLGDGSYVTVLGQGSLGHLYRHDAGTYKNGKGWGFVNAPLVAGCWDGTSGGAAATDGSTVYFVGHDGVVTNSVGGLGNLTGADWSPWDGSILMSRFGRSSNTGIVRVKRTGQVTPVGPTTSLMAWNACIEVRENPSEEYLCTDTGSVPNWVTVTTPGGVTSTLFANAGGPTHFAGTDVSYRDARNIWGDGAWVSGQRGNLFVSFPRQAGKFYGIAMSLAHTPGVRLGSAGTMHLVPDALFALSLSQPGVFVNFAGQLDSSGEPQAAPFVRLPAGAKGIRVYAAAAAFDTNGIREVSNAWGITLD